MYQQKNVALVKKNPRLTRQHNYTLKELVDGYTKGDFDGMIAGTSHQKTNSRNFLDTINPSNRFSTQSAFQSPPTVSTQKNLLKRLTSNNKSLKGKKDFFTKLNIKLHSGFSNTSLSQYMENPYAKSTKGFVEDNSVTSDGQENRRWTTENEYNLQPMMPQ